MDRLSLILLAALIQGCGTTAKYYLPEGGSGTVHLHSDANCTVPGASYQFELDQGVNGYVSASAGADGWGISYGFSLSKGAKLQVVDPVIGIQIMDSGDELDLRMGAFVFAIYGGLPDRPRGYHEYLNPDAELVYTGLNERPDADYLQYDTFRSGIPVPGQPPMQIEIRLPELLVNGEVVQPEPVLLHYVERKYRNACIQ